MADKTEGVTEDLVILKHANNVIPADYIKSVSEYFAGGSLGCSYIQLGEHGKRELICVTISPEEFTQNDDTIFSNLTELMEEEDFVKRQVLFHLTNYQQSPATEDLQPFVLLKNHKSDLPVIVGSVFGDLRNWHNSEFAFTDAHWLHKHLVSFFEDVDEMYGGDVSLMFRQRLNKPFVQEELLRKVNNDGGVVLMGIDGSTIFVANTVFKNDMGWGIVSDDLGFELPEKAPEPQQTNTSLLAQKFKVITGGNKKSAEPPKSQPSVPAAGTKIDKGPTMQDTGKDDDGDDDVKANKAAFNELLLKEAEEALQFPPANLIPDPKSPGKTHKGLKKWYQQHFGYLPQNTEDPSKHWDHAPPLPMSKLVKTSPLWKKYVESFTQKHQDLLGSTAAITEHPPGGTKVTAHVGPPIEKVGPVYSKDELEKFATTILPKIKGHGDLVIDSPDAIAASEKKNPSFCEQTGLDFQEVLMWPYIKYKSLGQANITMLAQLTSDIRFALLRRMLQSGEKKTTEDGVQKPTSPSSVRKRFFSQQ